MNVRIALYGALREADPRGYLELDVPAGRPVSRKSYAPAVQHLNFGSNRNVEPL